MRFSSHPPLSSRFSDHDIFMIFISELTDSSIALLIKLSYLSGCKSDKHEMLCLVLTDDLCISACCLDRLSFRHRRQLKIEYLKSFRNIFKLLSVSRTQGCFVSGHDDISYFDIFSSEDVSFLTVMKRNERDPDCSIGIIFDSSYFCRDIEFIIPSEVDDAVQSLVPTSH